MMTCSTYGDDGSAEVHFKQKFDDGGTYESIEEGSWSLKRNKLTKTMKDQYGKTNVHTYRLTKLTEDVLEYVSHSTNTAYAMRKADSRSESDWASYLPESSNAARPPRSRSTVNPDLPELSAEADPNDPVAITRAFISDFEKWNEFAYRINKENVDLKYAREAYDNLLRKYCADSVKGQGVSFGNRSMHRADFEDVESFTTADNTATVCSIHTKELAGSLVQDRFEYHYERTSRGWRLQNLYLVLDDERVECL